ncbi:MAG: hypothetical protein PF487_09515 [Bacteroidales bacterium]|jgi:hypothetical protein|nr:hypothetical protein [Bacteroidales bacterium]
METQEKLKILKVKVYNVFLNKLGTLKYNYLIKDIIPLDIEKLIMSTKSGIDMNELLIIK